MGSLLPGACKTDSFSAKGNAAVSKISQAGHRRRRRRLRHHASKIQGFVITFPAFLNFSRLVLGDFDVRRVQQDEQVNDVSRGITNRLQLYKDERRQLQDQFLNPKLEVAALSMSHLSFNFKKVKLHLRVAFVHVVSSLYSLETQSSTETLVALFSGQRRQKIEVTDVQNYNFFHVRAKP
ncbi:hypothetical protein B296_00013013 [Ensete ventricosum]|uniref:Uncharacterized protein n=1 Tax=Ensete ventricosum TaxID=4639 RepID=A0A426ZK14_ENSVE|nr:hypothetical protein B296_00013013 [Ensete ventricosum]